MPVIVVRNAWTDSEVITVTRLRWFRLYMRPRRFSFRMIILQRIVGGAPHHVPILNGMSPQTSGICFPGGHRRIYVTGIVGCEVQEVYPTRKGAQ
jgi:hypothetical protein